MTTQAAKLTQWSPTILRGESSVLAVSNNYNTAIKAGVPITMLVNSYIVLQLQVIGDLSGNVLEADRRAGNATKSNAIERKPRQSADLHFPL